MDISHTVTEEMKREGTNRSAVTERRLQSLKLGLVALGQDWL